MTQLSVAVAVACCLALSACGGVDGVDFNGKIFDIMGLSNSDTKAREPKMADRAPLVVPPNVTRLPEPGSGQSSADVAAINDPELRKQAAAKERERLHLAYCRGEVQWKDKAYNPQNTSSLSPYGPCPNILGGITGSINK